MDSVNDRSELPDEPYIPGEHPGIDAETVLTEFERMQLDPLTATAVVPVEDKVAGRRWLRLGEIKISTNRKTLMVGAAVVATAAAASIILWRRHLRYHPKGGQVDER